MIEAFLNWCSRQPVNMYGEPVIYLENGAILILGTLFGIIAIVELVDRIKGGNGVFF